MLNKKTDDVRQLQNLKGFNSELEAQISETKLQLRKLLGKFASPSRTWRNGMQRLGDVKPLSELQRGLGRLEWLMELRND